MRKCSNGMEHDGEAAEISREEVARIAHLARLRLADDEVAEMGSTLSRILRYMKRLGELPTDGVEPTAHAVPLVNVYREDRPQPSLNLEAVAGNAPHWGDGFFEVPKVLGDDGA